MRHLVVAVLVLVSATAHAGKKPRRKAEVVAALTPDDVVDQASRAMPVLQRCYQRALKQQPGLAVDALGVIVVVGARGRVDEVALDPIDAPRLTTCLTSAIRKWTFPASTDGIAVKVTLAFAS